MKIHLLIGILLVTLNPIAFTQIVKGSIFTGGSVGYYRQKQTPSVFSDADKTQSQWSVRSQIGKAFQNNRIAGVFLNVGGSTDKMTSPPSNLSRNKSSFYGGGFFLRNYYSIGNRFCLFGEGAGGAWFSESENRFENGTMTHNSLTGKETAVEISLAPGISFAASPKVHLEAALGDLFSVYYRRGKLKEYSSTGSTVSRESKTQTFGIHADAAGLSTLYLGVRFILP